MIWMIPPLVSLLLALCITASVLRAQTPAPCQRQEALLHGMRETRIMQDNLMATYLIRIQDLEATLAEKGTSATPHSTGEEGK